MSRLLDDVRNVMRLRHYSYETEKIYIYWIRQYVYFHNIRHPKEMGAKEIEAFLTNLAVNGKVSASTQNQSLFALLFLYRPSKNCSDIKTCGQRESTRTFCEINRSSKTRLIEEFI